MQGGAEDCRNLSFRSCLKGLFRRDLYYRLNNPVRATVFLFSGIVDSENLC